MANLLDLVNDVVRRAKVKGADAADALAVRGLSLGASVRLGKREDIERSEGRDLGLRVFIGKQQAFVSSTDIASSTLDDLVNRAIAMAKAAPEDPFCGLADPSLHAKNITDLDLYDETEPTAEDLYARAQTCEQAALDVKGISNSEGGSASWGRSEVALATSQDFSGTYRSSSHGVSVSVIAGNGTGMERDYDFSSTRHLSDLEPADLVGRRAGEQAVKRLNPRKVETKKVPVIYAPRVAGSLLGHFAGAIAGPSIARGTSFLKDMMGKPIFGLKIAIVDDPHRKRGLRSKPFDGEGVLNRFTNVVENGELKTWLLDSASARQLSLASTGHATRGTGGPPGPAPTNFYLTPGARTPKELIGEATDGLYVTELIGFGVNAVTGDYSRGAAGFWIEKGELAYPVSEITIAGNLKDMFLHLTPASDLEFRYGTDSPTILIDGMTVAGL